MGVVVPAAELPRIRAEQTAEGRRVVLTNGYFDLIHVGHARYLQAARALGDVLVVGVNADATARRRKDPRRPIVPLAERAELLAALACVDYVVPFDEDTAEGLVRLLKPDVYAKGGDYAPGGAALPEAPAVAAVGGRVVILPYEAGHSTTDIVETVLQRYGAPPA
jgi:rfaE bifunctional protein nucleotidyltransferase chain/domain